MKLYKILLLFAALIVVITACKEEKPIYRNSSDKIKSNLLVNPLGGWIKITKKDCGPNGYSAIYITENSRYYKVRCEYPGFAKMPEIKRRENYALYPFDKMVKAIHYANKQISSGKLSGQEIISSTHIRIRWEASSSDTNTADSEILAW